MNACHGNFPGVGRATRRILERVLGGADLSVADAMVLEGARRADLDALVSAADDLRRQQVGDTVTYVVNRNINFTNICVKSCRFCAFSRHVKAAETYFLSTEEVVRRAVQAHALGATEVCVQAGLPPGVDGRIYIDLCRAIKRAVPALHVHGFSPEEVVYGARLARLSIRDHLLALQDAGLGSLPGTSAEILDDDLRQRLAPGRLTTRQWVEVVTTAHALGIPTTSTMMFGHIESAVQRARHLALLRDIQRDTGGFTEFVPLSFVHHATPLSLSSPQGSNLSGPSADDVARLFAIARLMLGKTIPNLQVSWVKEGHVGAKRLLACGANDLGGVLMNESISTAAGAPHGEFTSPATLRQIIRATGRTPAQRDTLYRIVRAFPRRASVDAHPDPLDGVTNSDDLFGTYASLTTTQRAQHPFVLQRRHAGPARG